MVHAFYCIFAYFPIHNEYRPDGEIMMYYAIFMLENILMVALPYGIRPLYPIRRDYTPGSNFYDGITIFVLVASAVGLVIVSIYYFFLHKSHKDILQSHFSCFGDCVEISPPQDSRVPIDDSLASMRIYSTDNANNENINRQFSVPLDEDDVKHRFLSEADTIDIPPPYRSKQRLYKKHGESAGSDVFTDSDASFDKTPTTISPVNPIPSGIPRGLDLDSTKNSTTEADDEYESSDSKNTPVKPPKPKVKPRMIKQ